jgi:hypothetical protein
MVALNRMCQILFDVLRNKHKTIEILRTAIGKIADKSHLATFRMPPQTIITGRIVKLSQQV